MRGRLHLLSRKCHVWIWKVVCPWTCLAAECVQACKKHRTASSCLVRVVRGLIGGISCDGLGLGRVLCRMETDLIGGRVIVFTLGVVAGLVSSTLLTRFPVMLLISVLGGVFGRPAVSVVVLRTGMGMGFPSIQVCIPGSSRWCGRSCHERNLSEPSRGDREGHRCLGISRPGTSTRWTAVSGNRSFLLPVVGPAAGFRARAAIRAR